MNILEAAKLGASERGAAEYLHQRGWVDKDDKANMWPRAVKEAQKVRGASYGVVCGVLRVWCVS